jgi:hypothetical protein
MHTCTQSQELESFLQPLEEEADARHSVQRSKVPRRLTHLRPREVTARDEALRRGVPPAVPASLLVPPHIKRRSLRKYMRAIEGELKQGLYR